MSDYIYPTHEQVELIGGPMDGDVITVPKGTPDYLIALPSNRPATLAFIEDFDEPWHPPETRKGRYQRIWPAAALLVWQGEL